MSKVLTLYITVDDEMDAHTVASELHALVQHDQQRSNEDGDTVLSHIVKIVGDPHAVPPGAPNTCDECGATYPAWIEFGFGTFHAESCSLHPQNVVKAGGGA